MCGVLDWFNKNRYTPNNKEKYKDQSKDGKAQVFNQTGQKSQEIQSLIKEFEAQYRESKLKIKNLKSEAQKYQDNSEDEDQLNITIDKIAFQELRAKQNISAIKSLQIRQKELGSLFIKKQTLEAIANTEPKKQFLQKVNQTLQQIEIDNKNNIELKDNIELNFNKLAQDNRKSQFQEIRNRLKKDLHQKKNTKRIHQIFAQNEKKSGEDQLRKQIQRLEKENKELKQRIKELESCYKKGMNNEQTLSQQIQQLQEELATVYSSKEQEMIKNEDEEFKLNAKLREKESNIKDLSTHIEKLQFTLNNIRLDLQATHDEAVKKEGVMKKEIIELKEEIDYQSSEINNLQDHIEKMEEELFTITSELQNQRDNLNKRDFKINELLQHRQKLQTYIDDLKRTKKNLLQKISQLQLVLNSEKQMKQKYLCLLQQQQNKLVNQTFQTNTGGYSRIGLSLTQKVVAEDIPVEYRIEYIPFEKKYIEYDQVEIIERIPYEREIVEDEYEYEYEEVTLTERNPIERTITDYYAVETQIEYIPKEIEETIVEYEKVERVWERVQYLPVEVRIVHYPERDNYVAGQGQYIKAGYFEGGYATGYQQGVTTNTTYVPSAQTTTYVQSGYPVEGGYTTTSVQGAGQSGVRSGLVQGGLVQGSTTQYTTGPVYTTGQTYTTTEPVYTTGTYTAVQCYVTGGSGIRGENVDRQSQTGGYVIGGSGVRQ